MKDKALIFDIDGTAINSPEQKLPSERLVSAVRKLEQSYKVCAATGRVWSFANPVLQGLSLVDPCIISGGTQICNPQTGEIIWQCTINESDFIQVLQIAKKYSEYKILFNDYNEDDYLHGGLDSKELKTTEPVYFFEIIFVPNHLASKIVEQLKHIKDIAVTLVVAQREGFNDIHVTNRQATKEHAIHELCKILNIEQDDTTGVGDGHNDLHLFRAVGHKVAMGNAVNELKDASDEIIGTVTDDGLAKYIEQIIAHAGYWQLSIEPS